jgi:nucleoside 2-deoxyribosyltransferase
MTNGNSTPYCFVIMSFGGNSALQDHYEHGIKPIVTTCGFDCVRADEVEHNGRITDEILGLMRDAAFIIADLTDEKPNCYYELGYIHALRKDVIHTINKQSALHFDVKDYYLR